LSDYYDDTFDEGLAHDTLDDHASEHALISESDDSESLIRRVIGALDSARAMPLSTSVLVSRDELLALLHGALDRLPDEMRQARWLLKERDEFIESGRREAEDLLEEVRAQAERMVQRTEIVRHANQIAHRTVEDAREEARRLRHEAEDFCDQRLASFEIVLERTLKTVIAGREKLQATPAPFAESPAWRTPAPSEHSERSERENVPDPDEPNGGGFFDQDEH
jgi:vacuolar-type H+-ATPase subunit H